MSCYGLKADSFNIVGQDKYCFLNGDYTDNTFTLSGKVNNKENQRKLNNILTHYGGTTKDNKNYVFNKDNVGFDLTHLIYKLRSMIDHPPFIKELQFYPTPSNVAITFIDFIESNIGYKLADDNIFIIEPSAGKGSIIEVMINKGVNPLSIVGIDINLQNTYFLELYLPFCNIKHDNFLNIPSNSYSKEGENKLIYFIGNPPYEKGKETSHILKMLDILSHTVYGGIIAMIMPNGFYYKPKQEFKNRGLDSYIKGMNYEVFWDDLPPKSFKESGTTANCGMLLIKCFKNI
jgi:hypothetical protein